MTVIRVRRSLMPWVLMVLGSLASCGGDGLIDATCDEPQRYQNAVDGKRVVAPDGLDPLNERAEMPIPKPENAPERPPGSPCIELPPRIGSSA
ncbi:MAG: hypothetical protein ACR2QZ_08510 [Woeseiaceae bacterium]